MTKRISSEVERDIVAAYTSGIPKREICDTFDVHPQTVYQIAKRNNLQIRKDVRGSLNPGWKGGFKGQNRDGYVIKWIAHDDPFVKMAGQNGPGRFRILEHRLVMAQHLGRVLKPGETVHHINGNRADNRIENLQLRQRMHGPGVIWKCIDCGSHNVQPEKIVDVESQ